MNWTPQAYENLAGRLSRWAETQADIRLAFVIGSRARVADHPSDEWADMDIVICTRKPRRYLSTTEWVTNVGSPG